MSMYLARAAKVGSLLLRPRTWPAAIRTRTAAATEHLGVIETLRPGTVIDVGANKGQFSLAVRAVMPDARIFAFEPLESAAAIFHRNLGHDSRIRLMRHALADAEGTLTFHVTDREDSSSLLAPANGSAQAYDVHVARVISVPVRRLDACLTPLDLSAPTLLKIDVQGAEAQVLAGATALLPMIDYVYVEASFVELYAAQMRAGDLVAYLSALGFSWRGVFNPSSTRAFGSTQADLLFERRSQA